MKSCVCSVAPGHTFLSGAVAYSILHSHILHSVITSLSKYKRDGNLLQYETGVLSYTFQSHRRTFSLTQLLKGKKINIYFPNLILSIWALQ